MNYPDAGQQPPTMYSPPRKPFPVGAVVLSVMGLLFFLAFVVGIKVFHAAKENTSEAIAVGNSFIDNMGLHNYQAAYALYTPEAQAKSPLSVGADYEKLAEKYHVAFVNHGVPAWFINNYNGQTSVRLTYPVQFTKSTATVTVTLIKTDAGYQVYSSRYDL